MTSTSHRPPLARRIVMLGRRGRTAVIAPRIIGAAVVAFVLATAQRQAVSNSAVLFDFSPPGVVAKQQVVYFTGEGMNSRYLAVASRQLLAPARGPYSPAVYQPYLTIYSQNIDAAGPSYLRLYQSPGSNDTLRLIPRSVRPAPNAPYLPQSSLALVGAAEFRASGIQQLVITVQSAAADCGSAKAVILGMNSNRRLIAVGAFQNPCMLSARIKTVPPDAPATLSLLGPYYAPTAPLCCPTKPRAISTVRWIRNAWEQTPGYFRKQ